MKRVRIVDIIERQGDNKYSLLLLEEEGHRAFVVNIGLYEAWAIVVGIKKIEPPRPITHQLMLNILNNTDLKLKEVHITEIVDKIFYAKVKFHSDNNEDLSIDSRPSDGIALAAHMGIPICVSLNVLDEFSFQIPEHYRNVNPNQKGMLSIIEKMTRKKLDYEIHKKSVTKNYIAETTREIIELAFSN